MCWHAQPVSHPKPFSDGLGARRGPPGAETDEQFSLVFSSLPIFGLPPLPRHFRLLPFPLPLFGHLRASGERQGCANVFWKIRARGSGARAPRRRGGGVGLRLDGARQPRRG
ncbi:unnamed protein product, partial [Prorocentrum cordatum]